MSKLRVGLLFGGRSVEHEVSITSATSILRALDGDRYEVRLIGIDREGHWHLGRSLLPAEATASDAVVTLPAVPGGGALVPTSRGGAPAAEASTQIDVVFPIVHGTGGEDGTLQGLLELADVPYVGAGVLGSAIQMDKEVAKRLLAAAGIAVVPWVTVRSHDLRDAAGIDAACARVAEALPFPVFAKPANCGSSVGVVKAPDAAALPDALREAARFDHKILVEQGIDAREIEVAVLGNDQPEASVPGEIVAHADFYDYEAKYQEASTELLVPAPLDAALTDRIRGIAIEAYRVLEGRGLGRVDFLLDRGDGALYVNELNSLPGFTEVSMYPKMWEASGLPYPALIDRLIELALEAHENKSELETTRE